MSRVPRVWDLIDRSAARAFLGPDSRHADSLPVPCRAVLIPDELSGGFRPDDARQLGLVSLTLSGSTLLAGTADRLFKAASSPTLDARVAEAVESYAAPPTGVVFADGRAWDLSSRARVMGILNVTPDSFSDGGRFDDPGAAAEHSARMAGEGAEVIDLGAASTRPGAGPVDATEEWRRLEKVVPRVRHELPDVRLSIDTRRAATAERALGAGCDMVNDVSGLADPAMAELVGRHRCPVVLMHMRGTPRDMQLNTVYEDLPAEVAGQLAARVDSARSAGIHSDRILIDPGFGFGKSPEGNENLLLQLGSLRSLGQPILIGVSRKNFIGRRTGIERPDRRGAGSLAAAIHAVLAGARVVRTHDAGATRQALDVAEIPAGPPAPRFDVGTEPS